MLATPSKTCSPERENYSQTVASSQEFTRKGDKKPKRRKPDVSMLRPLFRLICNASQDVGYRQNNMILRRGVYFFH